MTKPLPARDLILELVIEGMSDAGMAAEFGVSTRTVERWRQRDPALNATITAVRAGRPRPSRVPPQHGTSRCYDDGCRNATCRHAHTDRVRAWRARIAPARPPTKRDIEQAIARTGRISGAMRATGADYATVQAVWKEMNP